MTDVPDRRPAAPGDAAPGDPAPAADPAPVPATPVDATLAAAIPVADPPVARDPGDASLLALIDRLTVLLDRSELTELEIETGGTSLTLRKPSALAADPVAPSGQLDGRPADAPSRDMPAAGPAPAREPAPSRPSVKAPLTGIWYASPSPGSAPYVDAGSEVVAGQVIGLIEAMKLFNEIKSDISGRVVRVVAESGKLVKARQPLIEVEPL